MEQVFVYWDNSNVFHEAQRLAEEREGTPGARYLIRIHFENLLRLAEAGRPLAKAVAAGSVPSEMQQLWNRMENRGVQVRLFDRGERDRGEQEVPDRWLQLCMLEDALDNNGDPGIVALLTGDGRATPRGRASTARWSGCTGADGGWRCSPGRIRATRGCADGRRRTACSCPWTTTTRRSPSVSCPARATSSRRRETKRRSICHAAAWCDEERPGGREDRRGRSCVARNPGAEQRDSGFRVLHGSDDRTIASASSSAAQTVVSKSVHAFQRGFRHLAV